MKREWVILGIGVWINIWRKSSRVSIKRWCVYIGWGRIILEVSFAIRWSNTCFGTCFHVHIILRVRSHQFSKNLSSLSLSVFSPLYISSRISWRYRLSRQDTCCPINLLKIIYYCCRCCCWYSMELVTYTFVVGCLILISYNIHYIYGMSYEQFDPTTRHSQFRSLTVDW